MLSQIKTYVIATLVVVLGGLLVFSYLQAGRIDKQVAEIALLKSSNSALLVQNETLEALRMTGTEIAEIAAQTCTKTIKVRIQHQEEAKEIQNAPDDTAAARAYDDILCRRPEAAGHPRCADANPG